MRQDSTTPTTFWIPHKEIRSISDRTARTIRAEEETIESRWEPLCASKLSRAELAPPNGTNMSSHDAITHCHCSECDLRDHVCSTEFQIIGGFFVSRRSISTQIGKVFDTSSPYQLSTISRVESDFLAWIREVCNDRGNN